MGAPDIALLEAPLAMGSPTGGAVPVASEAMACFHCGEPCPRGAPARGDRHFCCQGCLVVHDLLSESGLGQFYRLEKHPGVRVRGAEERKGQWACLDELSVQQGLLDFADGTQSRVTLHLPGIHCVACVWLLENLFRLHPGIGTSRVNFPRREVSIAFAPAKIRLSELVELLASIGYEPRLTLGDLGARGEAPGSPARAWREDRRRQWLQIGIAGFAFGNIMLLSLPAYLGMTSAAGGLVEKTFGYASLALALPVFLYSAADYWRSAWASIRQRVLTLDVPIALGLAALYAQSAWEILFGHGEGYLDSMAGLVFLLLCGRVFQQRTHDRLAFDKDYRFFFPLWVTRRNSSGEESVAVANLAVGDRLLLRHGELIPADSRLAVGTGFIDYSFVTGESEPCQKAPGDYLYAGGRQLGGMIEVETVKPVSQSYLASLWNHEAFQKDKAGPESLNALTNRYSRRFTPMVIGIAAAAGLAWWIAGDPARGAKAFASVLIVACPCALALAAPFTLGTAQRMFARLQLFLRNALVIERLAQVDTVVFDKTGTLTDSGVSIARYHPLPGTVAPEEAQSVAAALSRHSTHPVALAIRQSFPVPGPVRVEEFREAPGRGMSASINGRAVRLGSAAWLGSLGTPVPGEGLPAGSTAWLQIDDRIVGAFAVGGSVRPRIAEMVEELAPRCEVALLSGDNERERDRFRALLGRRARLLFDQSPLDKLRFVARLQREGRVVMMVGDGLNDAGALKQSDVGVAVVERAGAFSPASDVIIAAPQVPNLARVLSVARSGTRIVRWSFAISALYNLAGVSIAAAGILSPLICAVLMPLSSASVVLFACGAMSRSARRAGMEHCIAREKPDRDWT